VPSPRRRPTIQDLARAAGTSSSTASRALSGRGYVAAEVRARVLAAAERIGYVPDGNARSLRSRTSRAVGVLVSDLRDPFYADLAAGIEGQLRSAGYHVILVSSDGEERAEAEGARTFLAVRVSAAIITPVSDHAVRLLIDGRVPLVQAARTADAPACDRVLVDDAQGALEVTSHLTGLGHTVIALLAGDTARASDLSAGYRAALGAVGVRADPELVVSIRPQAGAAREATDALLDRRPDVTALFAAGAALAEGAFQALSHRGLRVPDDISLVAFGDVPWMSLVTPGITTVDQHAVALGRMCARLVIERVTGPPAGDPTVRYIEPTLVVRGSAAEPARRSVTPS
jgi:LacI family transcriptional regulator